MCCRDRAPATTGPSSSPGQQLCLRAGQAASSCLLSSERPAFTPLPEGWLEMGSTNSCTSGCISLNWGAGRLWGLRMTPSLQAQDWLVKGMAAWGGHTMAEAQEAEASASSEPPPQRLIRLISEVALCSDPVQVAKPHFSLSFGVQPRQYPFPSAATHHATETSGPCLRDREEGTGSP